MNEQTSNPKKRKYWMENQIECSVCHAFHSSVKMRVNPYAYVMHDENDKIPMCENCSWSLAANI